MIQLNSSSHGNDFATKLNTVTNLFRDLADCGWKTSNEIMDERLDTSFFQFIIILEGGVMIFGGGFH